MYFFVFVVVMKINLINVLSTFFLDHYLFVPVLFRLFLCLSFHFILHRKHHCESDLRGFVAVDDFVGLASDLFPAVGVKQSAIFGIDL